MNKPEIPSNETERLHALSSLDILDTQPSAKFDRITRLCQRLFNVPIALVSLVDENRQWFKSCQGLSVSETSRDISFCGHAILGSEIFVINDASKDLRFSDNPLVTDDPNIRFYAGYPLKAINGSKLGTLCIIDKVARDFTDKDREALADLGGMVEQEINSLRLATIDELTKISNRRGFLSLAPHYLNFCKRKKCTSSLVFIDLDKFKYINDTYGHAEGDRALTEFTLQMTRCFRQTDLLARLGGDEFVVLLSNTDKAASFGVLDKFEASLSQYNVEAHRGYDLSFSYGVVQYDPEKHSDIDDLLEEGDALMYTYKQQRKSVLVAGTK